MMRTMTSTYALRAGFLKRGWSKVVPTPVERTTYVVLSHLPLAFLVWEGRPQSDSRRQAVVLITPDTRLATVSELRTATAA